MRRFVVYVCLFAFAVLITLGCGEYIVRSLPNSYKYKHQWMLENSSKVECLVMGSSHTYYGIVPTYFLPNTFNLANVSQNPKYDYLLLEKYIPMCRNLQYVIVPISYFTFFDESFEAGSEWFYIINYELYMDVDVYPDWSRYNFEISNRAVYNGKLQAFFSGKDLPACDSLGFGLGYVLDAKNELWEDNSYMTVDRHTKDNGGICYEHEDYLRQTVLLCRKNGVDPVFVTLPSWSSYYRLLDKEQLSRTYETIYAICQEYDLLYLDYLKDTRFNEGDFYDCDHLSDIGAKKFTQILKRELEARQK